MDICKLLVFALSIVAVENQSTISISTLSVRELSEVVRAHNTEIKLMKQQILNQQQLIESLQKQVEAGSAKPKIRLVNGNSSREGRVEVYKDGVWGTVCDDNWDFNEANVVCKQLFGLVGIPYSSAYFGRGTGLILMDDVRCSGTENSLLDCRHTNNLNQNCGHSQDAGVICMKAPPVRLSKQKDFQGRVEVYKNNRWGTICDRNWDYKDASVICRSLGYSEQGLVVAKTVFRGGSGTIHLNNVQCSGKETGLSGCSYSETHSCSHSEDAGAICILPSQSIRLRNGKSANEGIIEVSINGVWGAVCDTAWDNQNAKVACRSLGYSGGVAITSSVFGKGNTKIWLDGINCGGHENSLLECTQSVVGSSTCDDSRNAAVVCYNVGNDIVRLVNGSSEHEGRVEVSIDGQWRSVCITSRDKNYADVTCRSLGNSGGFPVSSNLFGKGSGKVWLNNIACSGNEDSLLLCSHSVIESSNFNCTNSREVDIICYNIENDSIRIVNGSSVEEGRVEVLINGQWGSVCDNGWSKSDADVTCKSLGYAGGLPVSSSVFGEGSGQVWLDRVNCYGNKKFLLECSQSVIGSSTCRFGNTAGVVCYHTRNDSVRIVNGSTVHEGRVEVLINGQWRSICDRGWGKSDAQVTCRSLGYSRGIPAASSAFGESPAQIWMFNSIYCRGYEQSLLGCTKSVIGSSVCTSGRNAGVVCYQTRNDSVRIVNGSSEYEGRVEVLINEQWRSICDKGWDKNDADVTCKSIGYSGGLPVSSTVFGEGPETTWMLSSGNCHGGEPSLFGCIQSVIGFNSCSNGGHAGVVCYNSGNDSVRLVNGSSADEGRVEVIINGEWQNVCDRGWDKDAADVTCKSFGYSGGLPVLSSLFGEGGGEIWLSGINCNGREDSLLKCRYATIGSSSCSGGAAGVVCYHTENELVRMVSGISVQEGRVEIFINGQWRSVCNNLWDTNDANVTCRGLGYSGGIPALSTSSSVFGETKSQMVVSNINCNGNEDSLIECVRSVSGSTVCNNRRNAGVVCYHRANDSVRIVNGSSEYEGRVEVLINEQWRSICDNGWDKNDADVTCKSIGYSGGLPVSSAVFGEGPETIWMLSSGNCQGHEPSLLGCIQSVIGSNSCSNGGHAGVVCYHTGNDSVRIVNGSSVDEGRVEVLINGEWQNVCDKGWDKDAADVTCKSFGYSGGLPVLSSLFGEGVGEIWVSGINCNGREDSLLKCRQATIGSSRCSGGAAGVVCYHTENELVRMVSGSSVHEGRVEVLIDGQWRSVCNNVWDRDDANVTCRGLGYSGGIPALSSSSSVFGETKGQMVVSNINCNGNEDSLIKCVRSISRSTVCNNGRHAGVVCYHRANDIFRIEKENSTTNYTLVNPRVLIKGIWIGFCKDKWDDMEARVICRGLGYSGYASLVNRRRDGNTFGELYVKGFKCTGAERTLAGCKFGSIGLGDCSKTGSIEVECDTDVRTSKSDHILVNSSSLRSLLQINIIYSSLSLVHILQEISLETG
ncbi:deleted in malignant brain tumors 1 protein-like [Saccostrea echinata]|uniref:deleted in malignant brain tumors 1 protein-like n=1 Tax=Saccostrea echinata TaxID=191078 RepID=UPI002A81DE1B|nr:deleted in malignant brain tumors 1 protein-like [Saccostrea echinata]